MAGGGRVEAVKRIGDTGDGGIKSKGHGCCLQIIVDRFWDPNHRKSRPVKLQGCVHRAIATDGDDSGEIELLTGPGGPADHFFGNCHPVTSSNFRGEVTFIGGAENRSSGLHDAGGILPGQRHGITPLRKHSFIPVAESDYLPAKFLGGTKNPAQDGVQSGAVASAGQNSDALS